MAFNSAGASSTVIVSYGHWEVLARWTVVHWHSASRANPEFWSRDFSTDLQVYVLRGLSVENFITDNLKIQSAES